MEEIQPGFPEGEAGLRLQRCLEQLLTEGHALLPGISIADRGFESALTPAPTVDGGLVARWLYRHGVMAQARWSPLLQLKSQQLTHPALLPGGPGWHLEGEWIYLDSPPETPQTASLLHGLQQAAKDHRCFLLTQTRSTVLPLPSEWIQQLKRHDAFHSVAVDPALVWLRHSLLSHCRSASPIHLTGEPGTDKVLLTLWAHAMLDDRPLSRIQGNQGRPRPGEWVLFEEVSELGEEQRHSLEEKLRAYDALPYSAPPLSRGQRPRHPRLEAIIGESAALSMVLEQVLLLAPRGLSVLIQGEPGVGKEAIARALHELSGRPGPFVALDMGAIHDALVESELFGHRKGAFTGADHHRPGAFRTAHGGTLFLDEIGNASPGLQNRLLRVLQEGLVQPVGEDSPVPVNVRVLSATNGDLDAMVRQGRFRADLLTRLSVAVLQVPPLRERMDDLDALAGYFLSRALPSAVPTPWCTPAARRILERYDWPGNIRELSNILQFAAAMAPAGSPIDAEHLGPLSPHLRRRVPVMTTSTQSNGETGWGSERHLQQTMTAVTLTVPPLRDRDMASRSHAVLSVLEGRPIHPAALRVLAGSPWWGNHLELTSRLGVLKNLPPGPIDLETLRQHLPDIMSPGGTAPIRVLLSPTASGQGGVEGFTREFQVASLLIGRIRRMEELQALSRSGDARGRAWMEAIRRICGPTDPTCLELGHLTRLSRVQAVITRGPEGLVAHGMPGASLPVMAGTLEVTPGGIGVSGGFGPSLQPLQPLQAGQPLLLGRGGELRIAGHGSVPYLQVFFFLGAIASEDLARVALERVRSQTEAPPATQENASIALNLRPEVEAPGLHVWPLNHLETEALTTLVATYRSGQLKSHVTRYLSEVRNPALSRLSEYLERAPRLSQYLVRLFEFPANRSLREQLRERLSREPDRETRLAILPEGIRRSLEGD